mmetsp:Transcript_10435/g.18789  ORF Transcript_10435/g.18789 Transcript_10435/m.18789 type:complete len:507 (-) Transcript_10435:26-1546(-)
MCGRGTMDPRTQLSTLKLPELKALCKEHGVNISGRKGELVDRLVETVGKKSSVARAEVLPSPARSSRGRPRPASATLQVGISPSASSGSRRSIAGRGRSRSRGKGRGRAANNAFHSSVVAEWMETCDRCQTPYDMHSLKFTTRPVPFWCPCCCIKIMDPFNEVDAILKFLTIASGKVDFEVDVPQLRQGQEIQVRMVRLGTTKVAHEWPHMVDFLIKAAKIFSISPPEVGHKRRDVPMSITATLRPGKNKMTMMAVNPEVGTAYGLAVVQTTPQSLEKLQKLVGQCPLWTAQARVRATLKQQEDRSAAADDDIVCVSSHKLSLRCPISMDRIEFPVRGDLCSHVQAFDLQAYLRSNEQMRAFNQRWVCPICSLNLRPSDLIHDGFVQDVLTKTGSEVDEVTLAADGTWRVDDQGVGDSRASCHGASAAEAVEEVDLDSVESEDQLLSTLCLAGVSPSRFEVADTPSHATLSPLESAAPVQEEAACPDPESTVPGEGAVVDLESDSD